jgi:hypothetical protein
MAGEGEMMQAAEREQPQEITAGKRPINVDLHETLYNPITNLLLPSE